MKVARVVTRQIAVPLPKPIGSALGQISSFGCILVFVHDDAGGVGENLVFTLNDRRTGVVRRMIEELADQLVGHDAGHIAGFWARAWKDINFLGHKGVPVVGISALDGALWDLLPTQPGISWEGHLFGFEAAHALGGGNGVADGLDGVLRVDDDAFAQPARLRLADADDVEDAGRVARLADDAGDAARPDAQTDRVRSALRHALYLPPQTDS